VAYGLKKIETPFLKKEWVFLSYLPAPRLPSPWTGEGSGEGDEISMCYSHASNKDLIKIENPSDQFLQKEEGENP